MPFTAAEIAAHLGGQVMGDPALTLKGFAPAEKSAASAVIIDGAFSSQRKTLIRVPDARIAFAKVLPLFFPEPVFPGGIDATAIIAPSAKVDPTAYVGPYCVVGENVKIGARSVLHGCMYVGANCN